MSSSTQPPIEIHDDDMNEQEGVAEENMRVNEVRKRAASGERSEHSQAPVRELFFRERSEHSSLLSSRSEDYCLASVASTSFFCFRVVNINVLRA